MWETLYGMVNSYPIVAFVFIPVYFSLGVTSVYQYLDLRFNIYLHEMCILFVNKFYLF